VPSPYNKSGVGTLQKPSPLYHSGATGIDIIPAQPEMILLCFWSRIRRAIALLGILGNFV
jgi:hypothetical protein